MSSTDCRRPNCVGKILKLSVLEHCNTDFTVNVGFSPFELHAVYATTDCPQFPVCLVHAPKIEGSKAKSVA